MTLLSLQALGWIAATVAAYWCLRPHFQLPFIAGITLAFLLVYAPVSGLALALIALTAYAASRATRRFRHVGLIGIAGLTIAFFAYKLMGAAPAGGLPRELVLLGFSFYVLRALHYLIEQEKGTLPAHGAIEFLSYMFFLPTLLVGPINRFGEYVRETRRRRWDARLFSKGLERILFGYAKIVILGNYLVNIKLSQLIGMLSEHPAAVAYLECLQYGLNLYFQFSGYSDVAIGFALLLGFRLSENFHFPFFKTNISAFWRSWHISLSSWCRDYIHTPVVAWTRRPMVAVLCSMVVLGLWHELSPRYVLWGAYHGVGIMAWQAYQGWKPALPTWNHPAAQFVSQGAAWFLTFNFVVLSFAITKEANLEATLAVYRQMLTP
jgi:alginate O-acetyltransferase complex protein AlgI